MKKSLLIALLLLIAPPAPAQQIIKISQLPLGTAAATGSSDVFPFVNSTTSTTEKMTIWDLINLPPIVSTYAPIASPTFTGTVSVPTETVTGVINFVNPSTFNAPSSNGTGSISGYSTSFGLALIGKGSSNDISLLNDIGNPALTVPTGTTNVSVAGNLTVSGLTNSLPVFTNGADQLVSNTVTGSGKVVMSTSPTLDGTVGVSGLSAGQAVFTNGATQLSSNAITGTGNVVMSASPTLSGTIAGTLTYSGVSTFSNATASSSSVTGAVIVSGGIGVAKASYFGSSLFSVDNTLDDGSGNVSVAGTISATSAVGSATYTGLTVNNTSATSGANGEVKVVSTSSGNPQIRFNTTGVDNWEMGENNSSSSRFEIAHSAALGSSTVFSVTTGGTVAMPSLSTSTSALDYLCWNGSNGVITADSSGTCLASLKKEKEKVEPIKDGLKEVMALKPISFDYKKEYNPNKFGRQVGFYAEDVEKVDRRLAGYDTKSGELRSVAYSQFVVILTKAVQEQQAEIEDLKMQLAKFSIGGKR